MQQILVKKKEAQEAPTIPKLISSIPICSNEGDLAETIFTINLDKYSHNIYSFPTSKRNYFIEQDIQKTLLKSIIINKHHNGEWIIRISNNGGPRENVKVVFY